MRVSLVAIALGIGLIVPTPALAINFSSCWVSSWINARGAPVQVTRCRIAGGATVDYASDDDVPAILYPNLGTDTDGQCWYYTSAVTAYFVVTLYADGSADIWYDVTPGSPGGAIVIGANIRRCTSEPSSAASPSSDAWNYVMSYVHDPPTPELNPGPGQGVTGLATLVGVEIPADHSATLNGGGTSIDVEIEVSAVVVQWGDGTIDTYPPDPTILAGYPDGVAQHVYETKDADGVQLVVSYDWTARWRLQGGSWNALPVPDTSTTVNYPIAEIVSRLGR